MREAKNHGTRRSVTRGIAKRRSSCVRRLLELVRFVLVVGVSICRNLSYVSDLRDVFQAPNLLEEMVPYLFNRFYNFPLFQSNCQNNENIMQNVNVKLSIKRQVFVIRLAYVCDLS